MASKPPKPEPIQQVEPAPTIDRNKRRGNARALSAAGFRSSILTDLANDFGGLRSTLG